MAGVLCPIRGGKDCQPTMEAAIELAIQTDQMIYFLHVIDPNDYGQVSKSTRTAIVDQFRGLGFGVLHGVEGIATSQGAEADGILREGNVPDEIINVGKELDINHVVLGTPVKKSAFNVFTEGELETFKERLSNETAATVHLAG